MPLHAACKRGTAPLRAMSETLQKMVLWYRTLQLGRAAPPQALLHVACAHSALLWPPCMPLHADGAKIQQPASVLSSSRNAGALPPQEPFQSSPLSMSAKAKGANL